MIWVIVWTFVLIFVSQAIPGYDQLFWLATWFIPPLILWPILAGPAVAS